MGNKIESFTTEELKAELARREKSGHNPGKDWYFSFDEDDDGPGDVWIVHKRFWHLNHHMDDRHIEDFLILPDGMHECMESLFDFRYSAEEAEQKLLALGYTKMKADCWSALVVQTMEINKKFFRVDMHVDTEEMKEIIEKAMKDYGHEFVHRDRAPFKSIKAYKNWMKSVVEPHNNIVEFSDSYGSGCSAFVIDKDLYESLPPYPAGYYE